ncbi:MAG TPA: glycosyltransferase family 2 protein [Xanthobacteraceae bacterium]
MATVAIFLGTYNAATFLQEQLQSFEKQSSVEWRLIASDDGSTDATLAMLSQFRERLGPSKVEIRYGPRQGFVANFLSLACDRSISADYFAYSDQDDVWESDKLSRALAWLATIPAYVPAMYCARTKLVDEEGRDCGYSPLFRRKPHFRNALVQSIAGGNTIVFNQAARSLLMRCGGAVRVPSHDWWTYLLTAAAGGEIHYDPVPSIGYRVHPKNVVGSNVGWVNRARRLKMLARGRFQHWTELNIAALKQFRPQMTPENRAIFDLFCESRKRGFLGRQTGFLKAGVYRQTLLGNLGLMLAVWTKKI